MQLREVVFVALVFASACGAAQPASPASNEPPRIDDPAALYARLEQRIRDADEVHVETDIEGAPQEASDGEAADPEVPPVIPERLRFHVTREMVEWEIDGTREGSPVRASMHSDANGVRFRDSNGVERSGPTRAELRGLVSEALARGGGISAFLISLMPDLMRFTDGSRQCCWLEVASVNAGEARREDGRWLIPLHLQLARFGRDAEVSTLWMDAATELPVRRETGQVVERYRRFDVRP